MRRTTTANPTTRRAPHCAARWRQRRGVAMLLVLGVVVLGSVLGYAMLSSAAMRQQATGNASASTAAHAMAESGVNLALYYLQCPDKAPGYPTTYPDTETYDRFKLFWEGTGGAFVEFGSAGAVKVNVSRPDEDDRWRYVIEAWGRAPGSELVRKVTVTVRVNAEFRVDHAAMFSADATLTSGTRIGTAGQNNGDTYSNGGLSLRAVNSVIGRGVRRKTITSMFNPSMGWQAAPVYPKVVPLLSEVRSYQTYECPAGTANTAVTKNDVAEIGTGLTLERLDPTPGNAAGVYYFPGDLTLKSGAEIHGTLIVGGNLTVIGNNVRLRAEPGFPALIVGKSLLFGSPLSIAPYMRIEGLTYVAERVDGSGLVPTLDIRGALLIGGTTPIFPSLLPALLVVNHDKELARVPDFSQVGRTPIDVKVISWDGQ